MDADDDISIFDLLTPSTISCEGEAGVTRSTTPSPPATLLGKRARNRPYTCCDFCKVRKVKCDGNSPCTFCSERSEPCVYSQRDANKRQKASTGLAIVRARPNFEHSLLTSNARHYYLDLFLRKINPMFRIADVALFGENRVVPDKPRSQCFEETVALTHAARALGHLDIAHQLYQQSRMYAGDLMDDFSSSTAAGFALMMMFSIGLDNNKAMHYAMIADSLTRNRERKCLRTLHVMALIQSSRILEGPNRPCYFNRQPIGSVPAVPFQQLKPVQGGLSLADVWGSPHTECFLDLIRTFPLNSPLLEVYCTRKVVARYPAEQRTDTFLPLDRVELALKLLHENTIQLRALSKSGISEGVATWITREEQMRQAYLIFVCAATGMVELARYYSRALLLVLREIPSTQAKFGFFQVSIPILFAADFVRMYKVHPFDENLDYRSYLREICDVVRPLAPIHANCAKAVEQLEALSNEPLSPPAFTPLPHSEQLSLLARWAALEADTLNIEHDPQSLTAAYASLSASLSSPKPMTLNLISVSMADVIADVDMTVDAWMDQLAPVDASSGIDLGDIPHHGGGVATLDAAEDGDGFDLEACFAPTMMLDVDSPFLGCA